MKDMKYTPGVTNAPNRSAGAKQATLTPSAEAKGGEGMHRTHSATTVVPPTGQLKSVTSPAGRSGGAFQHRNNSPLSTGSTTGISPKRPLGHSLSQGVYQQKRISEAMEQMSLYAPFAGVTEEGTGALANQDHADDNNDVGDGDGDAEESEEDSVLVDHRMAEDDLLDLFSPLNLTSIRNHRGQRLRDLVKGSNVRDYFSVFVQKEVPVPAAEAEAPKEKKPIVKVVGVAASGVGMPKAEKAFLAAYTSSHQGQPSSAIQTSDGLINLTTVTTLSPTSSGPMASYQTPTLSYSWRLATRRKSTTAANIHQAAAAAAAASLSPVLSQSPRHLRSTSPLPNRREWSPPPRSRPSPGQFSSGNKHSSPSRTSTTPIADPADALGLDKAIERLQSNLAPRTGGRRKSLF